MLSMIGWSVCSPSIGKRCSRSPTNRPSSSRTSKLRPSSPSKIARLLNELREFLQQQQRPRRCSASSRARPESLNPCSKQCWRMRTRLRSQVRDRVPLRRRGASPGSRAECPSGPRRVPSAAWSPHTDDWRRARPRVEDEARLHTVDDLDSPGPAPPARLAGAQTHLAVPMVKDDELVGVITIYRQEVRPFTDKQIALVSTSLRKPSSRSRTRACSTSCAIAAAADRHSRRAQGYQPLDLRSAKGARYIG